VRVCSPARISPGRPGSIDVIEIDAASQRWCRATARDLRGREFFAPVESRYKIYIIDEAHMVNHAGFNALLKLVEEHRRTQVIFATTEPDKVDRTIRSRTHHYPFRLVPPKALATTWRPCVKPRASRSSGRAPLVVPRRCGVRA